MDPTVAAIAVIQATFVLNYENSKTLTPNSDPNEEDQNSDTSLNFFNRIKWPRQSLKMHA